MTAPEQRARWEGSLRPMFELIKASEAALATVPWVGFRRSKET
jgi:hypothetical protein